MPSPTPDAPELHRIYFSVGNPWPEGHSLEDVALTGTLTETGDLTMGASLSTAEYRMNDGGAFLDPPAESDWGSKTVWNNFHRGSIGISLGRAAEAGVPMRLGDLEGREFEVDPLPEAYSRFLDDELLSDTYLLGHDATAAHRLRLGPAEGSLVSLEWTGRIALAYVGET